MEEELYPGSIFHPELGFEIDTPIPMPMFAYQSFLSDIENLEKLNRLRFDTDDFNEVEMIVHLRKLVFVGVMTALERFLTTIFINILCDNPEQLKKISKMEPSLKNKENEKLLYSISVLNFSDFNKFKKLFGAMSISFSSLENINKYKSIRNDIVHRGGSSKPYDYKNENSNGMGNNLYKEYVEKVIFDVKLFTEKIYLQLKTKYPTDFI